MRETCWKLEQTGIAFQRAGVKLGPLPGWTVAICFLWDPWFAFRCGGSAEVRRVSERRVRWVFPKLLSARAAGREREIEMGEEERESIRAASEEVSRQFKTLINGEEVESVKQLQLLILGRLQDSNAVLGHFNEYSEQCYAEVSGDFSRNTQLLKSIKSDLDHIFTKLRSMKAKLKATYPDAFPDGSATNRLDQRPDLEMPLQ